MPAPGMGFAPHLHGAFGVEEEFCHCLLLNSKGVPVQTWQSALGAGEGHKMQQKAKAGGTGLARGADAIWMDSSQPRSSLCPAAGQGSSGAPLLRGFLTRSALDTRRCEARQCFLPRKVELI